MLFLLVLPELSYRKSARLLLEMEATGGGVSPAFDSVLAQMHCAVLGQPMTGLSMISTTVQCGLEHRWVSQYVSRIMPSGLRC